MDNRSFINNDISITDTNLSSNITSSWYDTSTTNSVWIIPTLYKYYIQHNKTLKFYKNTEEEYSPEWIDSETIVSANILKLKFTKYLKDAKVVSILTTSTPTDEEVLGSIGLHGEEDFDVILISEEHECTTTSLNGWSYTDCNSF
jgi:hypothetical protein